MRQRNNVTLTSTTAQLSTSQLPNLFLRVNPQPLSQRSASGLCFACGKPGHWRAFCPNLRLNVPSNLKLLTLDVNLEPDLVDDSEDSYELVLLRINGNSFEVKSGDDYLSVKGRLCGVLKFWNYIHVPRFILDVQGSKYSQTLYLCLVTGRIFFYLSPPTSKLNNNLTIYFPFLAITKLNCGFTIDNISNKMIEAMTCQFILS